MTDMEPPDLDHSFHLDGAYARGLAGGEPGEALLPIVHLSLRGTWPASRDLPEALPVLMTLESARKVIETIQFGIDNAERLCRELEEEDRPG